MKTCTLCNYTTQEGEGTFSEYRWQSHLSSDKHRHNKTANDRTALLEAMKELFENCAMIHKHWGEDDNSKAANAAIKAAHEAIAQAEAE